MEETFERVTESHGAKEGRLAGGSFLLYSVFILKILRKVPRLAKKK
jgi:hypothetical protein